MLNSLHYPIIIVAKRGNSYSIIGVAKKVNSYYRLCEKVNSYLILL